MSLQLRLLVCTALTTVWFLASTVSVLQWLQRLSGSSMALPGPAAQDQRRQHWRPRTSGVHIVSYRGPNAGGSVVAGAVCRHMIVEEARAAAGLGPTVASLAATEALVAGMLSVAAHTLQVHTHLWACDEVRPITWQVHSWRG